jgi:hypothetical protein
MMKDVWLISLSDLLSALKRGKKNIFLSGVILGSVLLFWRLFNPLTYTAEGMFHTVHENPKNVLSKTLQSLGSMDASSSYHDDLRTLLDSPPVLKRVVEKLHLQAIVNKEQGSGLFTRAWQNIRLETVPLRVKKFASRIRLSDHELFPEQDLKVSCTDISYEKGFYTPLKVIFTKPGTFDIHDKKGIFLGSGTVGSPFQIGDVSFTLRGEGHLIGEKYSLVLIPVQAAIHALRQHLKVTPDKKKPSLIHFQCTGDDKKKPALVVNETMKAYHAFLTESAIKKMTSQLQYLEERKRASHSELASLMSDHKAYLSSQMQQRGFFNSENEVRYLNEKQREYHTTFEACAKEKEALNCATRASKMTLEMARELKTKVQKEIEALELEKRNLLHAADLLRDSSTEVASVAHLVKEPLHTARIQTIEYNLIDKKNWSPKEQMRLKEELDTEKAFLASYIERELAGKENQTHVLQEKMSGIKEELSYLLEKEMESTKNRLLELSHQMKDLPESWLKEQSLEYHKRVSSDLVQSIQATIEERNLSCHLNSLQSTPLEYGIPPSLPNPSRLIYFYLFGQIMGALIAALILLLIEISRGPTSSLRNLKADNREVFETLSDLYFRIMRDKKSPYILLFTSPKQTSLLKDFSHFLEERKESFKVEKMKNLKNISDKCDWILVESVASPLSAETSFLSSIATHVVYFVTDERLQHLSSLPQNTLFFIGGKRALTQVSPLLSKMMKKWDQEPAGFS